MPAFMPKSSISPALLQIGRERGKAAIGLAVGPGEKETQLRGAPILAHVEAAHHILALAVR